MIMTSILIFTKGVTKDNPNGDMGIGIVAYACENLSFQFKDTPDIKSKYDSIKYLYSQTRLIKKEHYLETSSNLAEHIAIGDALEYVLDTVIEDCKVYIMADMQFIVDQMNDKARIKNGAYVEKAGQNICTLKDMQEAGYNIEFIWIPKILNKKANDLAWLNFTTE